MLDNLVDLSEDIVSKLREDRYKDIMYGMRLLSRMFLVSDKVNRDVKLKTSNIEVTGLISLKECRNVLSLIIEDLGGTEGPYYFKLMCDMFDQPRNEFGAELKRLFELYLSCKSVFNMDDERHVDSIKHKAGFLKCVVEYIINNEDMLKELVKENNNKVAKILYNKTNKMGGN